MIDFLLRRRTYRTRTLIPTTSDPTQADLSKVSQILVEAGHNMGLKMQTLHEQNGAPPNMVLSVEFQARPDRIEATVTMRTPRSAEPRNTQKLCDTISEELIAHINKWLNPPQPTPAS